MATVPGTYKYLDRPGHCPRHSRPAPRSGAARVRMCVGCGSSVAVGPGAAPAADNKPGRCGTAFVPAAVHPEPRPKKPHRSREGEVLSLDSESLMWVRHWLLRDSVWSTTHRRLACAQVERAMPFGTMKASPLAESITWHRWPNDTTGSCSIAADSNTAKCHSPALEDGPLP